MTDKTLVERLRKLARDSAASAQYLPGSTKTCCTKYDEWKAADRIESLEATLNDLWFGKIEKDYEVLTRLQFLAEHPEHRETIESCKPVVLTRGEN